MGLINKLYQKIKYNPTAKIINRNKKYDLDRSKLENYLLKQDLTPKDLKKSNLSQKNELATETNLDSLIKSDNYTYVKDFVNRWDGGYTKQSLKILHKRLDEKGFKINKKDLKPLLIQIRELENKKNANKINVEKNMGSQKFSKNMDSLSKSDYYRFVEDFVGIWGDDYPDIYFKRLLKRLDNKGFKIAEKDLRRYLTAVMKLKNDQRENENETNLDSLIRVRRSKQEKIVNEKKIPAWKLLKNNSNPYRQDIIYLIEYMRNYGSNYPEHIPWLRKCLIQEKKFDQKSADLVINTFIEEQRKKFGDISVHKNNNILAHETNNYLPNIDSLNGFEFENFLSRLFLQMGYRVQSTKLSGDQGADLIISKYNEKIAVQAKRYNNNKVNNRAVQEVVASIAHYGANKGMVVTNSHFTKSAIELAKSNQIQLIDGNELNSLINKHLK